MTAPKIIFAKTRHEYGSYSDFWSLVRLSEFETRFVDDINLSENTIFLTTPINGDLYQRIDFERKRLGDIKPTARVIAWQLERPDENIPPGPDVLETRNDELFKWVDEVWVSDRYYASLDHRYVHVPLGSHPELREGGPGPERYDLCHISARFPRRQPILDPILKDYGKRVGPTGWGESRARTLNSSRAMVNVHKTPAPIGEPLRFAVAAAYKLPLITETLANPWPMVSGIHFLESGAGSLRGQVRAALARPDLQEFGDRMHNLLCVEMPFGKCVREALEKATQRFGINPEQIT